MPINKSTRAPISNRPSPIQAEELGQGEAIAVNLREMFGLRVPVLSVVIGEGGSGGALAIGVADRCMIMVIYIYII